MKIIQKIMFAVVLLGGLAMATPAQADEYWGCHRHHYWHHYSCYHHYYGCRPHYYGYGYGCGHHYHHHYHCW